MLLLLGCTAAHSFTATTITEYPARGADYTIEVLDTTPERPHQLIGYVEARGVSMVGAMPLLLKLARQHGGSAIVGVERSVTYAGVGVYKASVIRYTDGAP